ncbi:MAG: hypothetical protein ACXVZU_05085 [Methanobacteriaceae archaeon]
MHEIIDKGKVGLKIMRSLNVKIDETSFSESTNKYWDNLYKKKDVNY